MKTLILFDTEKAHVNLLPLSYTRPICDFRVGICTLREKWRRIFPDAEVMALTVDYLQEKFPCREVDDAYFIDSSLLPDPDFVASVNGLSYSDALFHEEHLLAFRGSTADFAASVFSTRTSVASSPRRLEYVFNIFQLNGEEIINDFSLICEGRKSEPIPACCMISGKENYPVFIEEGAEVRGCWLNPSEGPIYIGRDAEVMEGSCLRGPVAVGEHSKVNMGCKIYPGTTIGPWSKVGGELNNAVIFGYSNKAHDGFLGNAVVGEWCNIGAGTNASNLKNDYSKIRIWNYATRSFMRTDLQFCGLIMGDHSKAGINCMFNTATVVGVGVNFHGSNFPRPFIPSFSKGSCLGMTDVCLKNFFDVAGKAMARRGVSLDDSDMRLFEKIFEAASKLK